MEYCVEVREEMWDTEIPEARVTKNTHAVFLNDKFVWRFGRVTMANMLRDSIKKALDEIGKESDPKSRVLKVEKVETFKY
jgi:hypothetical protein